jgi:hypothetical protein
MTAPSRDLENLVGGGIEGKGAAGETGDIQFLMGRVRADDTAWSGGFFTDEELSGGRIGRGCLLGGGLGLLDRRRESRRG